MMSLRPHYLGKCDQRIYEIAVVNMGRMGKILYGKHSLDQNSI